MILIDSVKFIKVADGKELLKDSGGNAIPVAAGDVILVATVRTGQPPLMVSTQTTIGHRNLAHMAWLRHVKVSNLAVSIWRYGSEQVACAHDVLARVANLLSPGL